MLDEHGGGRAAAARRGRGVHARSPRSPAGRRRHGAPARRRPVARRAGRRSPPTATSLRRRRPTRRRATAPRPADRDALSERESLDLLRAAGLRGHRGHRRPRRRRRRRGGAAARRPRRRAQARRRRASPTRATSGWCRARAASATSASARPPRELLATGRRHGLDGPRPARRADGRPRASSSSSGCAATRVRAGGRSSASAASSTEVLDDVVDPPRAGDAAPRPARCSTSCAARASSTASAAGRRSTARRVGRLLVALGALGVDRPDIVEVDLNPVIASPDGARRRRCAGRPGAMADAGDADEPVLLTTATPWGVRLTLEPTGQAQRPDGRARRGAASPPSTPPRPTPTSGSSSCEGAGRAFCVGLRPDRGGRAAGSAVRSRGASCSRPTSPRPCASSTRPKPVIAQVHGYALAGGLELAMACDLVVAAEGTKLGEPEIRYGSAPVTLLMPYLIGQKKTRELLLTGDLIDAVEAERIGLDQPGRAGRPARRRGRRPGRPPGPHAARGHGARPSGCSTGRWTPPGFRLAVEAGLDLGAIINAADTPEQREWDAIVRRDGLKAALAWRDRRYDERLAGVVEPQPAAQRGRPRRLSAAGRRRARHRPRASRGPRYRPGMTRRSGGRPTSSIWCSAADALATDREAPARHSGSRTPSPGHRPRHIRRHQGIAPTMQHAPTFAYARAAPTRRPSRRRRRGVLAAPARPDHGQPGRRRCSRWPSSPTPTRRDTARSPPARSTSQAIPVGRLHRRRR